MNQASAILPTPVARWSRRLAIFSVQVVIVGLLLHRFSSLSTPLTLHLFATAMIGAASAVALAFAAFVIIWRLGRSGAWSAAAGLFLGLILLAWPLAYLPFYLSLPKLTDITTDPTVPPRFIALLQQRPKDSNSADYAIASFAKLQADAYPDVKPVIIPRPAAETFEMVGDIVRRFRWQVAAEQAPQGRGKPGYIEAVDRTLILGFSDDIVIRIDGDTTETRIDVRSASRYGHHDLGRNASRVRKLFTEIRTQLETGVPGGTRRRRAKPTAAVPKRPKGGLEAKAAPSKKPGSGQSNAQRAPQPKAKPPARAESPNLDRQ